MKDVYYQLPGRAESFGHAVRPRGLQYLACNTQASLGVRCKSFHTAGMEGCCLRKSICWQRVGFRVSSRKESLRMAEEEPFLAVGQSLAGGIPVAPTRARQSISISPAEVLLQEASSIVYAHGGAEQDRLSSVVGSTPKRGLAISSQARRDHWTNNHACFLGHMHTRQNGRHAVLRHPHHRR